MFGRKFKKQKKIDITKEATNKERSKDEFNHAMHNSSIHAWIKRRGQRSGPPPLKNHKNIGFLSYTGPDPLKNYKNTKQTFNLGPTSAIDDSLVVVY